tara:strand:+ start:4200 stop:4487 length:288 start_codon:yes stop_codon:yes gene_type:complete
MKRLHKYTECVILHIGDIVIDNIGGHIGILVKRQRHIDMVRDDIFVWEVKWINNIVKEEYTVTPATTFLEEAGLKLSIVVGTYEWHSINGGTFEL